MELELTRINHLGGSLRLRRELLVSSLEGVQISFYNDVLSRLVSFFFFSSDNRKSLYDCVGKRYVIEGNKASCISLKTLCYGTTYYVRETKRRTTVFSKFVPLVIK